jgi:hypothetical protein
MGMGFRFKTKKDALAFAAAVEKRFKLMTDTTSFSHIKDAGTHPDGHIWQVDDLNVEVERPDWDGLDSPSHVKARKIEDQIEALAEKEFGGEFVGT